MAGWGLQPGREEISGHVRLLASIFLLDVVRRDESEKLWLVCFVIVKEYLLLGRLV